jgi:ATP-dependent RNA helicase RhlE
MYRNFRKHSSPRQRTYAFRGRKPRELDTSLFVKKAATQTKETVEIKHTFADFLISDQIKQNIAQKGYHTPTPIQDQVIPLILEGKDVIGLANTGTGKTGAFLVPLLNKILYNRSQKVLIIAPTRELAVQIQDECKLFAKNLNIYSVLAIGGESLFRQANDLRRNPNIVIGTPGRLKDLIQQGKLNLTGFNNTVLDEVDRMLDMGFINDIRFLISKLPFQRQSLFFSATLPQELSSLAHSFLKNPITISLKTNTTVDSVEQDIVKLNGRNKIDVLHNLIAQDEFKKVIIFGRTKWGIEKLSKNLLERGFKVASIHGNKSQNQRLRALEEFKQGKINILLATDVASRGLDIDNVSHVINYDPPATYNDYIHRIGRTGRADKTGVALTFVD